MNLKFGTGGLRAIMGEGPDCLNIKTIREATLGVANYIKKKAKQPKVAILPPPFCSVRQLQDKLQ